ncbi:hypothetical protein Dtox_2891 [Desulfofarcimen acetoxidans DSM 771]|uniref:Uncharacterized protein n=1 Tax=Desulfofarcimen acetoxidans (strain ATCC 49208 / DSM 771 / KCTC 5769 / VKM B-1644 / 5575) TaxID=485916 RepID=C8W2H0_DESAS|nr:hypothetical protein Dtox_2891 [Desulfofarcimen acetoxidans DSM 771]
MAHGRRLNPPAMFSPCVCLIGPEGKKINLNHYKIAGLTIAMEGACETLQRLMKSYGANINGKADITMSIDREKMHKTGEEYPHLSPDEWEYIQTGYAFACKLPDFDGFCLHASAVALNGRAVLFSGPCGTGKSTHTHLWRQYFGPDRVVVINDDKPVLRRIEDIFYVYGTPWSGKRALNTNIRVLLSAVVFLKQARENHIRRLSNKEAVQMLFYQSQRPGSDRDRINRLLTLMDALLQKIPVYQMDCDISFNAVKTAYNEICQLRMETENKR